MVGGLCPFSGAGPMLSIVRSIKYGQVTRGGTCTQAVPVSGLVSGRMRGRLPRRLFTDHPTLGEDRQGDPPAERIHSPQRRTSERPPPGTSASTKPVIRPSVSSAREHLTHTPRPSIPPLAPHSSSPVRSSIPRVNLSPGMRLYRAQPYACYLDPEHFGI